MSHTKIKISILITYFNLIIAFSNFNVIYGQNKINIDSLKQNIKSIINKNKEENSIYKLEIYFDNTGKQDLAGQYIYSNEKTTVLDVSFNENGLIFTTTSGTYTLVYTDRTKIEYSFIQDPNSSTDRSWIKYYARKGTTIIAAACEDNYTNLSFFIKNYNVKDYKKTLSNVQNTAKDFYDTYKLLLKENQESNYNRFKSKIESVNTSKIDEKNQSFSEEQRKLIVQANLLNENKDYNGALELYNKAMNMNEFSYPEGYYNMALIAAQLKYFNYAIINMNKYLLLKPNSEDARKAQDKIYEWELNIKQ